MIDIESQVYTPIAVALRAAYPGVDVSGEYVNEPSKFPHVSVVEANNYTTQAHRDTGEVEKYSTVMYEVNVYSNKGSGKKSEAKAIMNTIDALMYRMNFTRLSLTPVPNMQNASIYRMTARYEAETDGTNLYRR